MQSDLFCVCVSYFGGFGACVGPKSLSWRCGCSIFCSSVHYLPVLGCSGCGTCSELWLQTLTKLYCSPGVKLQLTVRVILLAFLRLEIHHLTELFQDSFMQHLILHEPDTKVMYENYIGCLSTEAETMVDMTETGILPACAKDLQQVNGSGNSKFVTTRKVAYEAVVDEPFVWAQARFVQSWCSSFFARSYFVFCSNFQKVWTNSWGLRSLRHAWLRSHMETWRRRQIISVTPSNLWWSPWERPGIGVSWTLQWQSTRQSASNAVCMSNKYVLVLAIISAYVH